MNLSEYQTKARSTAIYPETAKMLYPALGIIGECGEVAEKVKKLIRDDNGDLNQDRKNAIAKELGDCCWYLANICYDTDLDLNMMYKMRGCSIKQLTKDLSLPQLIFHMNMHTTTIAIELNHWYHRHNCDLNQRNNYIQLPFSISHVIDCIEKIAERCDFTLEEIYVANVDKLARRKREGKLQGDGDSR